MRSDPHTPIMQSAEFQAAVEAKVEEKLPAAVQAALDKILPALILELKDRREELGTVTAPEAKDDNPFAQSLAFELAKLSAQHTGVQYLDPAEVERRRRAGEQMLKALANIRAQGITPSYTIIAKTHLPIPGRGSAVIEPLYRDQNKIQRSTEIGWAGVPNLAMRPNDEYAAEIFDLFTQSIGGADLPIGEQRTLLALDPMNGNVIEGNAAAAILRNDRSLRGGQTDTMPGMPTTADQFVFENNSEGAVLRGQAAPKRRVAVFGGMPPIEVS